MPAMPAMGPSSGIGITCPTCGFMNEQDASFCERDGTPLGRGGVPPVPTPGPLVAFLLMPDQSQMPLPATTRVFGRTDFVRYVKPENAKEISRGHFTVTQANGVFFIQDGGQDPKDPSAWKSSINRTSVNGVILQPGAKQKLNLNDVIDVAQLGLNLVFKTQQ
jgi:FHA domain